MPTTFSRRTFLHATGATTAAAALGLSPARAVTAMPPRIGAHAPAIRATDILGAPVDLDRLSGRLVVLEWTNAGCPFVRKHYDSGNMQALQAEATAAGATWISVISSAPGQQGHGTVADTQARAQNEKWSASHVVLDPSGSIGRAYAAKTTPHMFIIGADGTLLYEGGIDDRPTADPADIAGARNHVREALSEIASGKPVSVASTRPYGCSVKYAPGKD